MSLRAHRALITGGAGFIGSHLTRALVRNGCRVTVLDDLSSGRLENLADVAGHFVFIKANILDSEAVIRASQGCDTVFHQAAVVSVTRTVEYPVVSARVNELGTLNVLDAARCNGVRRVVLASSSAIYGDALRGNALQLPQEESMAPSPMSPYAVQKCAVEHYARLYHRCYGLETVCLRYFNVYGSRQDPSSPYSGVVSIFLKCVADDQCPTIYGDGRQTRDFVHIADVVQANLLAAEHGGAPGSVFNIGTGVPMTINALWRLIAGHAGCNLIPDHGSARPGDIRHSYASIEQARDQLGYKPCVPIEQGLEETYAWHQQNSWAAGCGNRLECCR